MDKEKCNKSFNDKMTKLGSNQKLEISLEQEGAATDDS